MGGLCVLGKRVMRCCCMYNGIHRFSLFFSFQRTSKRRCEHEAIQFQTFTTNASVPLRNGGLCDFEFIVTF